MKSHDQETKVLFAIVGIAVGLYGVFMFVQKIYHHIVGADPRGTGLMFIMIVILFCWLYILSSGLESFERKLKQYFGEQIAEFEKRLAEREREISWMKQSESHTKDERAQLRRWIDALSKDVRTLKDCHKKLSNPPSATIEEAILEITTEVSE
jgi:hypothetical protein